MLGNMFGRNIETNWEIVMSTGKLRHLKKKKLKKCPLSPDITIVCDRSKMTIFILCRETYFFLFHFYV